MLLFLLSCNQDFSVTAASKCDGLVSKDEETVDAPFDADGDGFFDGNNPDCQLTYEVLDCDDTRAEINPNAVELACDGLDNDCNEETLDDPDVDLDGYGACLDCEDTINTINPGVLEVECNNLDDDCDPETLDGSEDADGDGFGECEDCDDHNSAQNPGEGEIDCNGIDDDCDPLTLDGDDRDGDGWIECEDCDDNDATVNPGYDEVCDDGIDNDCNGQVDENCTADYSDVWYLDQSINYSCAFGFVSISFGSVQILDRNPDITIASYNGSQPGTMNGTLTNDTDFDVENRITGSCTEVYDFVGTFTDANNFTGTFSVTFQGGANCFDCVAKSWNVSGYR
jgi:hypothetical protein